MGDEVLETFELPLDADELELSKYPLESVRIWKEFVEAHNMGVLLPHGLAKAVGAKNPVTLFRMPPAHPRSVFRCAPTKDEVGYQPMTAFADAYPIHLINLASVRDLNKKIQDSIPELSAIRFRPNIILSGPPAFEEDSWRRISVGNGIYYTSCRTVRCKMPNVNQETGEQHPTEPDRTMRKYRCIDVGNKFNACMGMQVVPAAESGVIRVGDRITVLETGEHCYIDQ
ncbi:MOSC domain-containing protein [Kalaharituber pfeilii]|nr:MOSC domain-containing protein [Kalaharituber pfeilii]